MTRLPYGVRPPRVLGSLAALACVAALAGCGADDSTPEATASSPSSSDTAGDPAAGATGLPTTSESPSAEPSPDGPVRLDAAQVAAVVSAALDDAQGAQLTLDNGLGLLSADGVADFRDTPTGVDMTLSTTETGDNQDVEIRVVDGVLYVADSDRWLSVGVDSADNPFGSSLADQLDPRSVLDTVVDQFQSATQLPGTTEADDGSALTTYRIKADGAGVAAVLAPELADQDGAVVPEVVTCGLAVGADGLARTIVVDLGEDNGQLSYALSGWGTGPLVTVDAPAAGLVDDLPSLPGQ